MQPFGNQLSTKTVMMQDGTQVGTIYNVTADMETGRLQSLIVDPAPQEQQAQQVPFDVAQGGHYVVPAEKVAAIEDYVILSA